jgi:hypothetical protein
MPQSDLASRVQQLTDYLSINHAFSHALFWQDWQQVHHLCLEYQAPYSYVWIAKQLLDEHELLKIHTEEHAKSALIQRAEFALALQNDNLDCHYFMEKIIEHRPQMLGSFLQHEQHRIVCAQALCSFSQEKIFQQYANDIQYHLLFEQTISQDSSLFLLSLKKPYQYLFDYIMEHQLVAPIDTPWLSKIHLDSQDFVSENLYGHLQQQKQLVRPLRTLHRNWERSIHDFFQKHPHLIREDKAVLILAHELFIVYPKQYCCVQQVCTQIIDELVVAQIKTHGIQKNQDIPGFSDFKQAMFHFMEQVYEQYPEHLPSLKSSHPEIRKLQDKFILYEKLEANILNQTMVDDNETTGHKPSKI